MCDVLVVEKSRNDAVALASLIEELQATPCFAASLSEAVALLAQQVPDLIVTNEHLPDGPGVHLLSQVHEDVPVIIVGEKIDSERVLDVFALGAGDFLTKPISGTALQKHVRDASTKHRLSGRCCVDTQDRAHEQTMVVGTCPGMLAALKTAGMVAKTEASVLICGETGTGKELMAREIHRVSGRGGSFVALNCAAVADGVVESELFGHERGAFTGAIERRAGCFEQADGGTLFLDEIGDSPLSFQAKLLRALDRGEFYRVGGQVPVQTQVRVVAATNRDLEHMIRKERFRQDLFYRLSGVTISLPPLRERREDIPKIVQSMLARCNENANIDVRGLSDAAVECLVGYEWPGNLRELQHVIYRAALTCPYGIVAPEHLGLCSVCEPEAEMSNLATLCDLERTHIDRVLHAVGGNRGRACEILGISRPTLRRKMHRYHLQLPVYEPDLRA